MSTASVEQQTPATAPEGDELEQMLAEAERLANEMRNLSHRGSSDAPSIGSYVPETIQIKDSGTECSSMETGGTTTQDSLLGSSHLNDSDFISPRKEGISEEGESSSDSSSANMEEKMECKSITSSNEGLEGVQAVIQASEEMARTLEAIKYEPSSPRSSPVQQNFDTPESEASASTSPGSLSPFPASPESICGDSKTTAPVSHVNKDNVKSQLTMPETPSRAATDEDVKWEKVEYTKDSDDDYVPLKDYSREPPAVHKLKPKHEGNDGNNIKWEKLSSPQRADADYAPMADYSTKQKATLDFAPDPMPTFAHHHKALRRKRKQQKRMRIATAFLVLAAIAALCFWKQAELGDAIAQMQAQLFPAPEPVAPAGPTPEEIATKKAAEKKAAEERKAAEKKKAEELAAAKKAAEIAVRKAEEERKIAETKALEDERVAKIMKQTCGLPLAGLLSPVCREAHGGRGDRGFRMTQLVQAMLQ